MRIAAIDLGTNSFHLLAVEAHADGTFVSLAQEKEMLRLGDAVGRDGRVGERAADRAVATVSRFRSIADGLACTEVVACATSAIREADDGAELVERIERETGVEVRVVSGAEEARLIYAAVRRSVAVERPPAVCFDLGGGSLEVMVGDGGELLWSTSVKLGVGRLTAELVGDDPPSPDDLRRLRERATATLAPIADHVATFAPGTAVGSSGTICALARMAAARTGGSVPQSVNQYTLHRDDLIDIHDEVLAMTSSRRQRLPGVDARRADLLPAGVVVVLTALDLFGLDSMVVSEWALREGIVIDAIGHHDPADWSDDPRDLRRASVLALGRRCNFDAAHAERVAMLATSLFDQTVSLHQMDDEARDLLEHAALLHDIGEHVSTHSHHKHTAYLVQHGRLRGFDPDDVLELAALARYHRNSHPKSSHEPWASLTKERQERVLRLSALLRLADGLDRGHNGVVADVRVECGEASVRVIACATGDAELELWGARRKRDLFERLFERKLEIVEG